MAMLPRSSRVIPGPHGFDALVVGFYKEKDLMYVARVRIGFVPASRRQIFEKIRHLISDTMPFANLPDTRKSRWGDELTLPTSPIRLTRTCR